jgi:hypothetical protein
VKKQIALVFALCKLHNFLKDCRSNEDMEDEEHLSFLERLGFANAGAVENDESGRPVELIDGGNHFDDVDDSTIGEHSRQRTKVCQGLHKIVRDNPRLCRPVTTRQKKRK